MQTVGSPSYRFGNLARVFERRAEPAHTIVPERQLVKSRLPLGDGAVPERWQSSTYTLVGARRLPNGRLAAAALAQRALFLHRPLGRRKSLEALVRDRLAALDGEPVGARGQTLLRTVECGEPIAKVFSQSLVELVQIEVCGKIPRLEPASIVTVVLMPAMVERLLELAPLGGKQRPGTIEVHYSALSISAVRAGTRRTRSTNPQPARRHPGAARSGTRSARAWRFGALRPAGRPRRHSPGRLLPSPFRLSARGDGRSLHGHSWRASAASASWTLLGHGSGLLSLCVRSGGLCARFCGQKAGRTCWRYDACYPGKPCALRTSDHQRLRTGLSVDVMVARVRRPVRIAAAVENLMHRVPERENDRSPVVEGVVERENRGLLAAVLRLRRGERRRDFVDERSSLPQLAREIEKHFQLR